MAKRVKLSTQVLRELPFTYAHDGDDGDYQIIQGIADCLFEEEDGWVLLDYKTDRVREDLILQAKSKMKCKTVTEFS